MTTVPLNSEEDAITAALAAYIRASGAADPRALAKVAIAAVDIYNGKVTGAVDNATSIGAVAAKTLGNHRP